MTENGVENVFTKAMEGLRSGVRMGENPSRATVASEVERMRGQGLGEEEIERRLAPYFVASDEYGERELDLLADALSISPSTKALA